MDEINQITSKYSNDYIKDGLKGPNELRSFAGQFYSDVADIFDALTRVTNRERNPTGFSLQDAPILGLLVRMWKLLKEIVRYYEENNSEMLGLLDRSCLEASVMADYLMRGGDSVIEDYRKCSYRHRLRLLEECRAGSPFADTKAGKRLVSSIEQKLSFEALQEADFEIQKRHQWRVSGKSFYAIFDEVHGKELYAMTYGIMSESIHGSWNDSWDFDLVQNDDGTFSAFPFFQPADPRYVGPLIRFGVPTYRHWLQRIEATDPGIEQMLDWVERVNAAIFLKFDDYFDGP